MTACTCSWIDANRRLPRFARISTSKRVPYESIEQVAPSIEDLFVSAVEQEAAASAGTERHERKPRHRSRSNI